MGDRAHAFGVRGANSAPTTDLFSLKSLNIYDRYDKATTKEKIMAL